MSDGLNQEFRTDTAQFIATYFMTAVGFPGLDPGQAPFNLHRHTVDGNVIARLAPWNGLAGELPLFGYWVPQGGSCLVPATPPGNRLFVFTPDFSGCHIRTDRIDDANYRVYHVQGGGNYMQEEYLDVRGEDDVLAGQLNFEDYGTDDLPRAFAFLKYEDDRWHIYFQRQNGVGLGLNEGVLQAIGQQTVRGGGIIPVD